MEIVNDSNLDDASQKYLLSKILNNEITTEEDLKKEIQRIIEYVEIVNDSNLDDASQENVLSKIRNGKIITIEELRKEIQNKERKTEYMKIVNENNSLDDTSKWKLQIRINNNEIITDEEFKNEIIEEIKKTDLRIKSEEKIRGRRGQSDSYHPNVNKPWKY